MDLRSTSQFVVTIIVPATSAAVGGSWAAWRKVIRPVYRRVKGVFDKVDMMHKELGSNGGKSLADTIHRTAQEVSGLKESQIVTEARVSEFADQLATPTFEAAPDGSTVRISRSYETMFGYSPSDMLEKRWIRILYPDDRTRYLSEWQAAVQDKRYFEIETRFVTQDPERAVIRVRVIARPMLNGGRVIRWIGRVEPLHIEGAAA